MHPYDPIPLNRPSSGIFGSLHHGPAAPREESHFLLIIIQNRVLRGTHAGYSCEPKVLTIPRHVRPVLPTENAYSHQLPSQRRRAEERCSPFPPPTPSERPCARALLNTHSSAEFRSIRIRVSRIQPRQARFGPTRASTQIIVPQTGAHDTLDQTSCLMR